ncbi:MAG: hypothetical protein JWM76_336 [Pseudonocardiales bacterium]|nr:hypothetical protein [Pseudonocardiales bacterium]
MLKVTPEQLHSMSGSVGRTATDVAGSHSSLKSQLSPLFGNDWSGTASAQFMALYDNFDKHARGLTEALQGIGSLLSSAGTTYASAEQQIASSFRG